jgi:hypothetical protein
MMYAELFFKVWEQLEMEEGFDLIYKAFAKPGRVLATPCKQGNKGPVVIWTVQIKGRRQDDACCWDRQVY